MARVTLGAEGVELRRLGRARTVFYEEVADAGVDGRQLTLRLRDGTTLSAATADAADLARAIRAIVSAPEDALPDLATLRTALAVQRGHAGFAAAPYVELLLRGGAELGASDVHLLPNGTAHHVSLRLDGVLHEVDTLPTDRAERVVGRLKVTSGALAHRRDIPQEGRADVPGGYVRLSFAPAVGGEAVTVRLFDRLKGAARLGALGFDPAVSDALSQLLAAPRGVILFAGPSASGKTTTLYTALRQLLADRTLRAVTVEDPVEFRLPGVVQLEARAGLEGAELLRAALRHDADVLVVGEARDAASVELMLRAGITGHRVLATVHAGSAAEALVRLAEAGAAPSLLGTAVVGVVAQRLLRRRCCEAGCARCNGTGYAGRLAVGEVLRMDDPTRAALGLDVAAIAAAATLVPMRVPDEVTDAAEIARVFG